jgi:hypothetical protein
MILFRKMNFIFRSWHPRPLDCIYDTGLIHEYLSGLAEVKGSSLALGIFFGRSCQMFVLWSRLRFRRAWLKLPSGSARSVFVRVAMQPSVVEIVMRARVGRILVVF